MTHRGAPRIERAQQSWTQSLPGGLLGSARVRATRRLLDRIGGADRLDRIAAGAARLIRVDNVQVSLLSDVEVVAGGFGLPAGNRGASCPLTESMCALAALQASPLVIADTRADARVASVSGVTEGRVLAYLGMPLVDADGQAVGAICAYESAPREWSADDLQVLEDLAPAVLAELERAVLDAELADRQDRLGLVVDAARIGAWDWDLVSRELYWDERTAGLFGVEPGRFDRSFAAFERGVHPDDREQVMETLAAGVRGGEDFECEFRVLRDDGTMRWALCRGRRVEGVDGTPERVIGALVDVTEAHAGAMRVQALSEIALELTRAETLEQVTMVLSDRGFPLLGASGGGLGVRDDARGVLQLYNAGYDNPHWAATDPSEIRVDSPLPAAHAVRAGEMVLLGEPLTGLSRFPAADRVYRDTGAQALACVPLRDGDRTVGVLTVTWPEARTFDDRDVELLGAFAAQCAQTLVRVQANTARLRTERRLSLLAEATAALSSSLDVETAISRLAQTLVSTLADWSVVYLPDGHGPGGGMLSASAHRDPARASLVRRLEAVLPAGVSQRSLLGSVLAGGGPRLLADITEEHLASVTSPQVLQTLQELGARSAVVAPVTARGHQVAVIVLVRGPSGDPYTAQDMSDVLDLGGRAGLAIDTLRLYEREHDTSATLQRALLTDPPQTEGARIAVRYAPAADEAQVGGDWYDAFVQGDGSTMLAIGDVVGHDRRAAAAMGQVRGLLRGIGFTLSGTPAEVLSGLDRAIDGLQVDTLATAVVARIERVPPGVGPAGTEESTAATTLRWSNAGHPPPLLLKPDGTAEVLLVPGGSDLLLGVDHARDRHDATVEIPCGSTLLLYTDGLVERRNLPLDDGIERLRALLELLADRPLEALCDELIERMRPEAGEDDVALVGIRLRAEDTATGEPGPASGPSEG